VLRSTASGARDAVARDEPIQTYYPSARVRFVVRFEDWGKDDVPPAPVLPPHLRKGKTATPGALTVVEQSDGSFLLQAPGTDANRLGAPQEQRSSSDGRTHVIDGIIPRTASLKRNGIRTADTLSLEMLYRDFPFDPRAVRACAVEFFMGCVTPEDYQRGIDGEVRSDATPAGGLPYHVVPDEFIDPYGRLRSNLRFQGWVDEWNDDWPEETPTVRFECVDNTQLLLKQEAGPKLAVDPAVPLDKAIATYLANYPQFAGLSVVYQPRVTRDKVPVMKQALLATKFRPELGPTPSTGGAGKLMVWDYLTDVCASIGHSIRVVGTRVVIQTPRSLYDTRLPARTDDPYVGRRLPSGRVLSSRLYLYGKNVRSMSTRRRFGTYQPQNLEVRCYQTDRKTTLVARWPEKGDRLVHPVPGNATEQKWHVIRVEGIKDAKTLKLVAQSYYESLGRRELELTVDTPNLASFGGGNLDPDALDLEPGDPVSVEVARSVGLQTLQSTPEEQGEKLATNAAEYLRSLGFSQELASSYQTAVDGIGMQSTFRAKQVSLDWDVSDDSEGSVGVQVELCNYVEARVDKPSDDDVTPADLVEGAQQGPVDVVVEDEVST
jgi:hypothetical protein